MHLAMYMAGMGHDVTLLTTSHPNTPNQDRYKQFDGVHVYYLTGGLPGSYSTHWYNKTSAWADKVHRQQPFDIVHSHNSSALGLYHAGWFQQHGIPHVITWHGTHIDWIITTLRADFMSGRIRESFYIFTVLRRLISEDIALTRNADAVIAIDRETIPKIAFQYFVPRRRIQFIPTGVDTQIFRQSNRREKIRTKLGLMKQQPLLLAASRLINEKGTARAIKAMQNIESRYPTAILLVAGDGPERTALEVLAERLGLTHSVRFLGYVDPVQMADLFNAADIFVNPILHTGGFNTTLAEAMACGCPVVASRCGGTPTLVENGISGFLIPTGSVKDASEAVFYCLENPNHITSIKHAAQEQIKQTFGWGVVTQETLQLFHQLIHKRHSLGKTE